MTEPITISGSFADLKSVKTRGVVQMIVEVPIEQADRLVKLFGYPQPGAEVPVAVARLVAAPRAEPVQEAPEPAKRKPAETHSDRANRLCGVEAMQKYAASQMLYRVDPKKDDLTPYDRCSIRIKDICLVQSKKEFDTGPEAAKRWLSFLQGYEESTGRAAEQTR